MSLKFALPLVLATACLPFVGTSHGQTYTELGDAGSLPASAQVVPGVAGVTYTSITGATTATSAIYDSDMYQITIATAETFTASTTAFVAGSNNFDDQLFLFNSSGVGVLANDDNASGGEEASLSTGTTLLAPGNYYLLIAGSGNYPVDSTGTLIFPNYTDGTTDPTGTYAAKSTLPITAYTGNTNEGGKYVIALTVVPAAVPEPGTYLFLCAGAAGLALAARSRRSAAR